MNTDFFFYIFHLEYFANSSSNNDKTNYQWHNKDPYPVVHLFGAVEDVHHDAQSSSQVLGGLCLACPSRPGWGTTHCQMEGLGEGDVAAISEGRDH